MIQYKTGVYIALAFTSLCRFGMLTAGAQQGTAAQTPESAQSPAAAQSPTPHGTVIFERSEGGPATAASPADPKGTAVIGNVTDADRAAPVFTAYNLDIHLRPSEHVIAVRALLTLRNDGDHALKQLPLQLSSTLHWDEIRVAGFGRSQPLDFARSALASDADHTGRLNEAAIELPQPLAPSATIQLDVRYSGTIERNADRLTQIGAPEDAADREEWDEISPDFVGLRGFGNVVWYPVSSVPVRLGDGDRLFAEIGRQRLLQQSATVTLAVSDETSFAMPSVAILNGTVVPVTAVAGSAAGNIPGLGLASLPEGPLRFQTLSLFLAERKTRRGNGLEVYFRTEDEANVQAYLAAASTVTPLMQTWFGNKPDALLNLFDLPAAEDAPFEERQVLFTGVQPVASDVLTESMSHSLTHAYFQSPRPWLNEGVANFVATLWTEKTRGREAALAQLDDQRGALALAEPGDGATDPGVSAQALAAVAARHGLLDASDVVFYRTKATYVLWMLRSIVGDAALQATLRSYDPSADTHADCFEKLIEATSKKDLHRFFEDWVYSDRGLPDLTITGYYPSRTGTPGSYLIAVDVTNSGGSGADVPIIVTSTDTQITERMYVPAHGTATHRVTIQGEPTKVQVNDGIVPETTASVHVQDIHYTAATSP